MWLNVEDAYGGDVFYLASLHLSIPLPLKLSLGKFRTHLFAQAGNLLQLYRTSEFSSSSSSTAQHSSQRQQEGATTTNFLNELVSTTRASVGAGLIMRTSFGLRVELNYAIPILTQPTDHTQNLQLGVAFEFI
jgi:outer membrane protein assembly factor BamA